VVRIGQRLEQARAWLWPAQEIRARARAEMEVGDHH
jgi:hypothetical protein